MEKPISLVEIRERYETAVRCPDLACAEAMEKAIMEARKEGDSLGGAIQCLALNVPAGVGEPLFDALDADIAKILIAVPAVKGVEFGAGFAAAKLKGSENNDAYRMRQGKVVALSNNAGGILGGLSSGMPVVVGVAVKPTSSIAKEQHTVNLRSMEDAKIAVKGRHDPCVVPKAVPVVEAAVATVLADHMIRAGLVPKVLKEKK
jgi:chorismate synthase